MIAVSAPQFRNLQIDLAGTGLQRAIIAASTSILPSLVAFVASRATKPVSLSIQHRVQRLLDRSTNHLTKMIPDPRLINLDHPERPRDRRAAEQRQRHGLCSSTFIPESSGSPKDRPRISRTDAHEVCQKRPSFTFF